MMCDGEVFDEKEKLVKRVCDLRNKILECVRCQID